MDDLDFKDEGRKGLEKLYYMPSSTAQVGELGLALPVYEV